MTLDEVGVDVEIATQGVGLAPVFQPIVSLPDAVVVGFEALARWPSSGGLDPCAVFAHARATERTDQLDRMCIDAAIASALASGWAPNTLLSLNCEPTAVSIRRSEDEVLARGYEELQLLFELTERSLLEHPHALLHKVAALRRDGFAIALDDVGVNPDSLALLDVISPDVVKLDLTLVQSQPDDAQARTLTAVMAHHERTGALILAEGIECDDHLEQALALGADLGQGAMFGLPRPAAEHPPPAAWSLPPRKRRPAAAGASPFDIISGRRPVRTARKETMTALSRHIESQARRAADPPILLAALQHAENFTGHTRGSYRSLATHSPLVAVFGRELRADPGSAVRAVDLDPTDQLCAEWVVLVLGPHTAAALIGREHDADPRSDCRDGDRRFDFVITYDRALVTAAACNMLDRMR
ncbi:sensor domain-containing phosphodiesterase [Mycobacterium parmense]|uniref:Uncharacterized protein n=1 Tax=Mycobacterium parmense TaxID=185642 RepID=A0A7I7YUP5_9MYCO|nr:EAL domain-containing protein [Mycobacterium parmense]MCV7351826.1 EAL domain-containing protein [Mycobacterium parmense]ORW56766.1 hypothetical protein AWC20_02740 [Mycobacterium parmense]BBZ44704.1 hypothetical protein MPRM_19850 [Mycobacterium parmense]